MFAEAWQHMSVNWFGKRGKVPDALIVTFDHRST
jgi:hypothetical protein